MVEANHLIPIIKVNSKTISTYCIVGRKPGEGEGVWRFGQNDIRVSNGPTISVVLKGSFIELLDDLIFRNPFSEGCLKKTLWR